MMEEIQKLIALQQSGAMDEKSLVLAFSLDNLRIERHGKVCSVSDLPQSFFRDKELIEAVQEAQVDGVDEKIRNVMARSGVILRSLYNVGPGRSPRRSTWLPVEDDDLIWAFKVVEVTGPAVVLPLPLDESYDEGGWKVVSLREELVELMGRMDPK